MSLAQAEDHIEHVVQHGAQESASALSRLLRRPVGVESFAVADIASVAHEHSRVSVVLAFETSGGVPGHLAFVLDETVAASLVASLTGAEASDLNTVALMALAEIGNIAASAFLNGVARVVGRTCLPSVPRVTHSPTEQALRAALPPVPLRTATLRVNGAETISVVFAVS